MTTKLWLLSYPVNYVLGYRKVAMKKKKKKKQEFC